MVNQLAAERKKKEFSQDELAKKVGTISVTIGRYESDEIKPLIHHILKILPHFIFFHIVNIWFG